MAQGAAQKVAAQVMQTALSSGATAAPRLAAAAWAGIGAAALAFASVSVVPAGHVGVVDTFGKVRNTTLKPGFHVVNPLARVHKMNLKTRKMVIQAKVPSKEGLTVELDTAVLYRLDPIRIVNLYKTIGPKYEDVVVRPMARACVRDLTSSYEAKALYTEQRAEMAEGLQRLLGERLEERGVIVEATPLKKLRLPHSLSQAIQSKLEMEQESQRMEFVLQRERAEAERKEIEAGGIAKFQEIVTQGINEGVLKWKAIEATEKLAESPNSKLVFIGNPKDGLPIMLGGASGGSSAADWGNELRRLEKDLSKKARARAERADGW